MGLCDINDIKKILARHGFKFSKSLGQNFLTAEWVPQKIAEMCGVDKTSCVFEIGPGIGCLTYELSKVAEKVLSVEIDKTLLPLLDETLSECGNTSIVSGDILKIDINEIINNNFEGKKVYACANLPYYITSDVISKLIESEKFEAITVMVQKEVAERICAQPGTSAYSAFSIYVNFYCETEILFDVTADCFIPQPKVDSAVIKLTRRREPVAEIKDKKLFFAMVRASFNQRRKTLSNSVSPAFSGRLDKKQIIELIQMCGFDKNIRGERLSIKDFANLSNKALEIM